MFEQTFVNAQAQTRKPWTVAVSLTLQTGLVATIVILPLLHPGTITPGFDFHTPLLLTQLTPLPPPPPNRQTTVSAAPRKPAAFVNPLTPPRRVPPSIDMRPDPAPEIAAVQLTAGDASVLGVLSVMRPIAPPPPTPVAAIKPTAPGIVKVGGGVQAALLISAPKPAYPPLAKALRVQGTVKLEAVIGRDGSIRNLAVTAGPALLVKAALEAVAQWRYRPTLLNGEPVEVITEIEVNFRLN